jgi:pilus assembly protein FimV
MRPILASTVAFIALIWMSTGWALGLGDVELRSALNQPLDARIELVSPREDELEQLRVGLASTEHFERYGLERSSIHARMRFEVVRDGRDAYVHVTTEQPVRDPFISFLLEARWAAGRLLREYTLLLDPPDFGPGQAEEPSRAVTEAEPRERRPDPPGDRQQVERPEPEPEEAAPIRVEPDRAAPRLGGRYGPVQRNQTLWNIADGMRPAGVSINQMMIALFEANPGAFDGNINRLRQGAVLRVPDRAELDRVNATVANREAARQNEEWQQARARVAEAPAREREDELRLVAPGDEDAEAVGVGTEEAEARIAELETALDRAREQRDRAEDDGGALRDQVGELEDEIEELRRLLALKDDQLASLQQRVRDDDLAAGLEEDPVFADEAEADPLADEDVSPEDEIVDEDERLAEADREDDDEALVALDDGDSLAEPEAADEAAEEEAARPATRHVEPPSMLARISGLLTSPIGMGILGALMLAAILGLVAVRRRQAGAAAAAPDWADKDIGDLGDFDEDAADDVEDVNLSDSLDEDDGSSAADQGAGVANVEELIEEADFHVAYGTYDKAATMLEEGLASHPDDARIHLKLAETHFAAGNADEFVEAARRFRDGAGDGSDEWRQVARMGRDIAPGETLFAGNDDESGDSGSQASQSSAMDDLSPPEGGTLSDGMLNADQVETPIDLDMDSDSGSDEAGGGDDVTFDLDDSDSDSESGAEDDWATVNLSPDNQADDSDDELSFDLPSVDEPEPESSADAGDDLDFGLDEESASVLDQTANTDDDSKDDDEVDFPTVDVPPEKASEAFGTDSQAQFEKAFEELSSYVGDGDKSGADDQSWQRDEPGKTTTDHASPGGGIDFGDDDDDTLDLGDDDIDQEGEIDTKIDLARAYIDMGDSDGARGILDEVIEEGNDNQKKEARSLLESI